MLWELIRIGSGGIVGLLAFSLVAGGVAALTGKPEVAAVGVLAGTVCGVVGGIGWFELLSLDIWDEDDD